MMVTLVPQTFIWMEPHLTSVNPLFVAQTTEGLCFMGCWVGLVAHGGRWGGVGSVMYLCLPRHQKWGAGREVKHSQSIKELRKQQHVIREEPGTDFPFIGYI